MSQPKKAIKQVPETRNKRKGNPNPSPATRFGAENGNPQSKGYWDSSHSISFQYKKFLRMTADEFIEFGMLPVSQRTVAQDIAYNQVLASRDSLPHAREITDRTEGKAPQAIDITTGGEPMTTLVRFIGEDDDNSTDQAG